MNLKSVPKQSGTPESGVTRKWRHIEELMLEGLSLKWLKDGLFLYQEATQAHVRDIRNLIVHSTCAKPI
jgi:hypothetical protein